MRVIYTVFLAIILLFANPLSDAIQGYWRISSLNGKFSLTSPTNQCEFLLGVDMVQPKQAGLHSIGYVSKDFDGDYDLWAAKTAKRIQSYGFSGCGAWSNQSLNRHLPYGIVLNVARSLPDIEDKQWEQQADELVKTQMRPNDKNLVGYWLDNELDWSKLEPFAAKYFTTISHIIRRYDNRHLILGVRFNHPPSDAVLIASRGCVDVHSFNIYTNVPEIWDQQFERAWRLAGVPSQVSEFSFYSDDNRSNDHNTRGFGGKVATQEDRAIAFSKAVKHWRKNDLVVGADFFQWNDEPWTGRFDGEDCNYGLVDIYDQPYPIALDFGKQ